MYNSYFDDKISKIYLEKKKQAKCCKGNNDGGSCSVF